MSNAWKKKRVSRKRTTISPSKQHHQLGQQDRVVSGSDQSRTQRERAQRYPFAGAGQQQSGQQGQGQLQIGAPLPLAHRLMLCLIVVLNQWRPSGGPAGASAAWEQGLRQQEGAPAGWAASAAGAAATFPAAARAAASAASMAATASASASGGAAITSARGEVNTQGWLGQAVVVGMEE